MFSIYLQITVIRGIEYFCGRHAIMSLEQEVTKFLLI